MEPRYRPKRRIRNVTWKALWESLSDQQRQTLRGVGCSCAVHVVILAILACITVATNALSPPPEIVAEIGEDGEDNEFELLTMSPADDLAEALTEPIEPIAEPMPIEMPVLAQLEPPLQNSPIPTADDGDIHSTSSQQATSSPTGSGSDSEIIAEIDRRVKKAGGELEGPIRISLMFDGDADIDLHVQYTSIGRQSRNNVQYYIWYRSKFTEHAALDVDANADFRSIMRDPCENVIFQSIPAKGEYSVAINCFRPSSNMRPTSYKVMINYGKTTKVFKGSIAFGPFKTIHKFNFTDR